MTDRTLSVWLVVLLSVYSCRVQAQSKYWIEFRDKGIATKQFVPSNRIFESTRKSLSEQCLLRRSAALHEKPLATISLADAPVCQHYIRSLWSFGVTPIVSYNWGNAISAMLTRSQVDRLRRLRFVRRIEPVEHAAILSMEPSTPSVSVPGSRPLSMTLQDSGCGYDPIIYAYGGSQSQLDRINVWPLHAMGFNGAGVRLGFLDVGFDWRGVSSLGSSSVLFEYDYVFQDSSTVNPQDEHGTETLSTSMGYLPDTLIGPAYKCSVMLAHTEDTRSERNIEEDNYAAALEDMEARGVEVTSSSLGYFRFDSGQHSYTYADMNGHTAICTQAVERAAKLGVLVVTAMGNNGADSAYPYTQAPADADSILGVGALDVNDSIAPFSSRGPTYDGRIKPDICAPGVNCWAQNNDGSFTGLATGTSFATPITSGACCLIKQAHPEATAQQIRHAVMITGSRADHPDTAYGWGKLNAYAAALELGTIMNLKDLTIDTAIHFCTGIASKYGVRSVTLNYFGDSDINPQSALFKLAADSLIYSCTISFPKGGDHIYYRITALDGSGSSAFLPSSGWSYLMLPQSSVSEDAIHPTRLIAFPNPCSTQFSLQVNGPGEWRLLDILGKIVLSGRITTAAITFPIETAGIPNGRYEIEFISSNGSTEAAPIIVAH